MNITKLFHKHINKLRYLRQHYSALEIIQIKDWLIVEKKRSTTDLGTARKSEVFGEVDSLESFKLF